MNQQVFHTLEPIWQPDSKILILGSMPSPKSREIGFYYGHPQNRFWKVLPAIFGEDELPTIEAKTDFLIRHQIALWDVLASCTIRGADDASIRDAKPNDLSLILDHAPIKAIFCTGKRALFPLRKTLRTEYQAQSHRSALYQSGELPHGDRKTDGRLRGHQNNLINID